MSFQEIINPSTLFLLIGLELYPETLRQYGFISAYVKDVDHEMFYDRPVYLLFKPTDISKLNSFIDKQYKKNPNLKQDYDYEGGYIVLCYSFPENLSGDYAHFLMGEYSKFSRKYKSAFPEYSKVVVNKEEIMILSLPYRVFSKSEDLKEYFEDKIGQSLSEDQEYWSAPDLNGRDCLNINILKLTSNGK